MGFIIQHRIKTDLIETFSLLHAHSGSSFSDFHPGEGFECPDAILP
jgi:hypothetical protein